MKTETLTKNILKYFLLCSFLLIAGTVSAHQPNYINGKTLVKISQPEISKSFYGILPNKSVRYLISTTTSFNLYVGLLMPELPEIVNPSASGISALVMYQDGTVVGRLEGGKFKWKKWHEEFAGDWYWQGPEFRQTVPAGTYTIIVYSLDNNWDKYVLAVGEIESFPLSYLTEMQKQIYSIKTEFFEKPWYSIFEGKIGIYEIIILGIVIGFLAILKRIKV